MHFTWKKMFEKFKETGNNFTFSAHHDALCFPTQMDEQTKKL
jgi:hypothetical protein